MYNMPDDIRTYNNQVMSPLCEEPACQSCKEVLHPDTKYNDILVCMNPDCIQYEGDSDYVK